MWHIAIPCLIIYLLQLFMLFVILDHDYKAVKFPKVYGNPLITHKKHVVIMLIPFGFLFFTFVNIVQSFKKFKENLKDLFTYMQTKLK